MSLLNELQGDIIKSPKTTYSYKKVLREKEETQEEREAREKAERRALLKKKKAELPKEEYDKWRVKAWYQKSKEKHIEIQLDWYYRKKAEEEAMIEEIYKDVYDTIPEPIDYDEYYTEKFKKDDTVGGEYKFYWRSSRLKRIPWRKYSRQHFPFRVSYRKGMGNIISMLSKTQLKAYQYLKPKYDEWKECPISLQKRQQPYKYPMYAVGEPLLSIANASEINNGHIICVADGIRRGKYIPGEVYLGRNSFIFGDVVVTGTGHLFRIALEHNFKWLTPDTVERIHQERMDWWKKKADNKVPIMLLGDAYLIKVPINERENLYYITPT